MTDQTPDQNQNSGPDQDQDPDQTPDPAAGHEAEHPELRDLQAPAPDRGGRFASLLSGGRRTIAAAAIAVLLLVGAGAGGYAVASGGDGGDGGGNGGGGRDGWSQHDRGDDGRDGRGGDDDVPLTGEQLAGVADAVVAEYPGAVIERAEREEDGSYEAHVVTTAGDEMTVELDESFAITGTEDDQ